MDSTEKRISYDNLPEAVATLLSEVRELRSLMETQTSFGGFSPWMDIAELCEYLPGHPAKCTVYEWIHNNTIPFHRCGKVYGFFRPEVDKWIMKGGQQ